MIMKTIPKSGLMYLSLAGAMIVGCYLRLHNIDTHGLWLDEAFSVAVSDPDNSFKRVYERTLLDVHPPLYQALLWLFYKAFGYAEISGRYLSVFFGVLLIPSVFCLGWKFFGRRTGLICAWLVAVNFYLITYSQETRSYALLVLLVVLSFLVFLTLLHNPTALNAGVYAVVAAMLVNTHYFGFFPVLAQIGLFYLMYGRKAFRRKMFLKFLAVGLFVLLTLLPSVGYIAANIGRSGFWVPAPDDDFFIDLFALYFGNKILSVMVAVLMMFGLLDIFKGSERKEFLWFFILWVGLCAMVPYMRSIYIQPVLTMRNLIIVLPALLMLAGYGLGLLRDQVLFYSVMIAVFCFSLTPLFTGSKPVHTFRNQLPPVSQMRDVIHLIPGECADRALYSFAQVETQGYAKVLGLELKIKSVSEMEKDIETAAQPLEFCLLSTHGIWIPDAEYRKKHGYHFVGERTVGDSSITKYRTDIR
ncbi:MULTISPECIES: glycosyltransferase family 39 protein [Pseudomonas]|uniref:glycosyltransferase family 39 protein n=1 Tax=Pseudomonas TaxID=286 RepID=UPI001BEC1DFA|nr:MULTISPECIES: glycosyltransferase family 39 protein [Pseudomonas]MBT2338541.1 glycosyltransferase family 39 protein [Pseudomonas fluorescens]MCD4529468.1 glycosyltransferase family 39 protein [Pseudomonas sp. C3-2018]